MSNFDWQNLFEKKFGYLSSKKYMKEYREISSSDRMSNIKDEPSLYHHVSKSIELKKNQTYSKIEFHGI